ncbi:MATE family efflux transporter [uncultured Oscillibacter sp.]|uniref:MATE family efflux transporter n=1 Tax=uncultured Oscillibacter sp. TaxID=876091 RepID=UPI0025D7EC23|nr:MATE family efflux transporter [uncultured Oscillibacter sp.]
MLRYLRRPAGFYKRLFLLALPLILQNLITTSLGFVDTFMVGLLGDTQLSAVTAANAPIYLVQVIIFGLMSGLTILVSQFWGKGDMLAINRCMGIAMYAGFTIAACTAAAMFFFPQTILSLVTDNALLITEGSPYLRIVGISYIFNAVSSVYVSMQRSAENPLFGMLVFATSMLLNTFLNYCFIFGNLGAPALGVTGAAIATLTSRIVEFLIVVCYAARSRRVPLIPRALFRPGAATVRMYVKYATPVLLNETLWGLGTTMMTVIMGHMAISADMLAAYAIMGNIDKFSTVSCFGLAGATAVIIGKRIGEGASKDEIYDLSWCLLLVALGLGVLLGAALGIALPGVFIPYLYPLFSLSPTATEAAATMCVVYLLTMPLKSFDISNITGVLRAGGDAAMASVIDLVPLWLTAVPLAALTALVLDAPLIFVCLGLYAENFFKCPWGIVRLRSRKWINDVTRSIA